VMKLSHAKPRRREDEEVEKLCAFATSREIIL
jgi:hypothetical protein